MPTIQIFLILPGLLSGYACDRNMNRILYPSKGFSTVWMVVLYSMVLILTLHDWIAIMKGILFAQILIIAGYHDALTHLIPDDIYVAILLDGLIRWNPIPSLIGFFTVSFPLYLIAMIKGCWGNKLLKMFRFTKSIDNSNNSIIMKYGTGGGDIKLLAACGFVLGPTSIVNAVILGSILFLLFLTVQKAQMKRIKKVYAMTPFYAAGCCLAYIMKG
ncbi:hypothetical protein A7X67_01545 [Clostridium sp. W14A]|nr:hypothetical protein A7X67_01545 [Clostridium sp. W14A]